LIKHSLEENQELSDQERKNRELHELDLLKQMTFYATSSDCLRMRILDYFGEASAPCGHCGNCSGSYEEVEISSKVRIIVMAVREMEERNRLFGRVTLRDFFKGSRSQAILDKKLDSFYGYGKLSHLSAERILQILDWMLQNDWLRKTDGDYPVIRLGAIDPNYWSSDSNEIIARLPQTKAAREKQISAQIPQDGLFEELRRLRREIANEQQVPAFMIFSDATLKDIVRVCPTTMRELLMVNGIGTIKANQYGQRILARIRQYQTQEITKK
jgi:ATP-dependent DNA helicase RecQ